MRMFFRRAETHLVLTTWDQRVASVPTGTRVWHTRFGAGTVTAHESDCSLFVVTFDGSAGVSFCDPRALLKARLRESRTVDGDGRPTSTSGAARIPTAPVPFSRDEPTDTARGRQVVALSSSHWIAVAAS